jgi:hypothetical protein
MTSQICTSWAWHFGGTGCVRIYGVSQTSSIIWNASKLLALLLYDRTQVGHQASRCVWFDTTSVGRPRYELEIFRLSLLDNSIKLSYFYRHPKTKAVGDTSFEYPVKRTSLSLCEHSIFISCTVCGLTSLKYNSTQLYRFVHTSQETHYVSSTSPTG